MTTTVSSDQLRHRAAALPRVALAHLPTPLEELPRLTERLGGPRIFIKRDDCTGLAFGGNKTRHNEFLLGQALADGADLVVWGAGVQSNNCRQTAAACARLGLDIHLVLSRGHGSTELQGNLLLDHIAGASYEFADAPLGPELDRLMAERAEQFRAAGRTVYVQSRSLWGRAAVSYVLAMAELDEQLRERQVSPAAVYVSATGATGAGLALGAAHLLANPGLVRSVLPIRWPWDEAASIAELANEAADLLGLPPNLNAADVRVDGGHVGPGYGQASAEGMAALALRGGRDAPFDARAFHELAVSTLPAYAVPVFVRLQSESDVTGTFKLRKVALRRAGYDPQATDDPIYVREDAAGAYVRLSDVADVRVR